MIAEQVKLTIRQLMAWTYQISNHWLSHFQGKVVILNYHRVLSKKELDKRFVQPGMYVREDVFETQIQFLKDHFEILSFAELMNLWEEKKWDKGKRYCVLTFDDGWLDNYIYAYPILKTYGARATIFLPTSLVGTNHWFWPDRLSYLLEHYFSASVAPEQKEFMVSLLNRYPLMKELHEGKCSETIDSAIEMCKGLPEEEIHNFIKEISEAFGVGFPDDRVLINWDEVEEMSRYGISFGSHSSTHRILTKLPVKEIQKEIGDSLQTLRERKINDIPVFCYPNGNYNQEIIKQVKAAGYQAAMGTHFGFEDGIQRDLFGLKRINIHNDISATVPLFTFHMSGFNRLLTRIS